MKIKYDKEIDAKYVYIRSGKIAHTKKEQSWLLLDCNKSGDVLGIEILDSSKHPITISTVAGRFLNCIIPEQKEIQHGSLALKIPSTNHISALV